MYFSRTMMPWRTRYLLLLTFLLMKPWGHCDTLTIALKTDRLLAIPVGDHTRMEKILLEITSLQKKNAPTRSYLKALIYYSRSLLVTGQFIKARHTCQKGLAFARQYNFHREEGILYSNLGIACINLGKPDTAIVYFETAGKIFSTLNDHKLQASSHQNIAGILLSRQQPDKALVHFILARKKFMVAGDSVSAAYVDINLALISKKKNEFTNGLKLLDQCYHIAIRKNDPELRFAAASNMADIYTHLKQFDDAVFYASDMLATSQQLKSPPKKALAWLALSRIYRHNQQTDLEKMAIDSVIILGEKSLEKFRLLEMYRQAAILYEQLHDYPKALGFYKKHIAVMEETNNTEINRMVMETEGRFDNNRKTLELARKEKELATRNGWIMLISGLFIILLLITGLLVFRHRKNIELLTKEKELASIKAMLRGEENERRRTSRELHDGLSALLAAVRLRFVVFGKNAGLQHDMAFVDALEQLSQAASETRRISQNLLPEVLLEHGLHDAIEKHIGHLSHGLSIKIHYHNFAGEIPGKQDKNIAMNLFRAIQELLNNAIKHSYAQNIYVQFNRQQHQLVLSIEDDGRGFEEKGQKGTGFVHLHERINSMNGKIDIQSIPGKGTTVMIYVPVS